VKHSGSPKSLTCSTPLTLVVHSPLNALSGKADVGWRTETYGPRSGSALLIVLVAYLLTRTIFPQPDTQQISSEMMVKTAVEISCKACRLVDADNES